MAQHDEKERKVSELMISLETKDNGHLELNKQVENYVLLVAELKQ